MSYPIDSILYLFVVIAAFAAIVVWAYGSKRKRRFENDARIPFEEGEEGRTRARDRE